VRTSRSWRWCAPRCRKEKNGAAAVLSEETKRQLRALGYIRD
jgi:hypothetical protein